MEAAACPPPVVMRLGDVLGGNQMALQNFCARHLMLATSHAVPFHPLWHFRGGLTPHAPCMPSGGKYSETASLQSVFVQETFRGMGWTETNGHPCGLDASLCYGGDSLWKEELKHFKLYVNSSMLITLGGWVLLYVSRGGDVKDRSCQVVNAASSDLSPTLWENSGRLLSPVKISFKIFLLLGCFTNSLLISR